jgi:hypothetical protein
MLSYILALRYLYKRQYFLSVSVDWNATSTEARLAQGSCTFVNTAFYRDAVIFVISIEIYNLDIRSGTSSNLFGILNHCPTTWRIRCLRT